MAEHRTRVRGREWLMEAHKANWIKFFFLQLVATITHQSHLCPLPLTVQPVIWNYDHCLHLYPTPQTVLLLFCYFSGLDQISHVLRLKRWVTGLNSLGATQWLFYNEGLMGYTVTCIGRRLHGPTNDVLDLGHRFHSKKTGGLILCCVHRIIMYERIIIYLSSYP